MALNIFEPRYRLMVRRCMEGNRLFGMATVNRQHELCEVRGMHALHSTQHLCTTPSHILHALVSVPLPQHKTQIACEAEILECQPLPDGRFYLEVLGRRRFRPAQTWEQASGGCDCPPWTPAYKQPGRLALSSLSSCSTA
jgi:Lon protease-like protein